MLFLCKLTICLGDSLSWCVYTKIFLGKSCFRTVRLQSQAHFRS